MKKTKSGSSWFFVDESGDPTFYNSKGALNIGTQPGNNSPILIVGFIETPNPEPIRDAVLTLQRQIVGDPYFYKTSTLAKRPSIERTAVAFHANDDIPEVRYLFYKLLATLNFSAQIAVARKTEPVFREEFKARPDAFYDHLVSYIFEKVLHRYEYNHIFFAHRGNRKRMAPLSAAIQQGIRNFETRCGAEVNTSVDVQVQTPAGEPCLSVIDYINWAVYQAYVWREMRFYRAIETKISLIVDLYDQPRKWFHRQKPFDIAKVTPL